MRDKLKKLKELPRLPGHRSQLHRDVEIAGVKIRVHKARSDRTVPVSARLLSLLGDELYALVAHSGEEDKDAGPLSALLGIDFDNDAQAKNAFMGIVLPILHKKVEEFSDELTGHNGPGSLFWYFERMLAGNVEYEDYRAQSMEELDEMGFGVSELSKLFWAAIELALFPTPGDPDTSPGDRGPGTPESSPAREIPSMHGESAKMTGRAAQISTGTG